MAVFASDAKGEVRTSHGGEAGSAGEHAEGVLEIAKDGVEPAEEGEAACGGVVGIGHRNPPDC